MSLNLNTAEGDEPHPRSSPTDWDAISEALADCADRWVPDLFPLGGQQGDEWRCANIGGDAPRKQGSCVIKLTGEHAGSWNDFGTGKGGGPVSTLKEHLRLADHETEAVCRQIIAKYGGHAAGLNGHTKPNGQAKAGRNAKVIATALAGSMPLSDPGAEIARTYFAARGLSQAPDSPDLLFNPSLAFGWPETVGKPAIVARIRRPDGSETGGIHRTYLLDDGSWHIGAEAKKMMGSATDGVVMLALIGVDGILAVAEGIETAAAAAQLSGAPGWATLSAGGMRHLGRWIKQNGPPSGLRRLLIFADRGPDGESAAAELRAHAAAAGISAEVRLPVGEDDFAADLKEAEAILTHALLAGDDFAADEAEAGAEIGAAPAPTILPLPATATGAIARIEAVNRDSDPEAITGAIRALAVAGLDRISEERQLDTLRLRTRLKKEILVKELAKAKREIAREPSRSGPAWRRKIILTDYGEAVPIMANIAIVLRGAPEWIGALGYDEFAQKITLRRLPPWCAEEAAVWRERHWTDADELHALEWMQAVAGIYARKETVRDAVSAVASEAPYHPVRDYLNTLAWDGKPRVSSWLTYYCGVESTAFAEDVGRCWLVGAVARIFEPGCKSDCALVLEGRQGIGKSSALRIIGDPNDMGWFADELGDFGSKDAGMQMHGKWVIELGELDNLSRAESSRIKSFMSRDTDHFRPPFGHKAEDFPRQCVFAGTGNEGEYLRDSTGARRFWPVQCEAIDLQSLYSDRHQLWAETVSLYKSGEKWHLTRDEAIAEAVVETDNRRQSDPWEGEIAEWLLSAPERVTSTQVFIGALKYGQTDEWTQADANRVARIMALLGWTRGRARVNGAVQRVYFRPGATL